MGSFTTSDRRLLVLATRRFAEHCAEADHRLSSPGSAPCGCRVLAARAALDLERFEQAESFDAGQEHVEHLRGFPDRTWTSTALLREVGDSWTGEPWNDTRGWFQRGVWATAALARLGERGIPADALVRRGLQRQFRLRLTALVVTARADLAVREKDSPRPPVAPALMPWVDALARCGDQSVDRDTDAARNLPVRIVKALTGGSR